MKYRILFHLLVVFAASNGQSKKPVVASDLMKVATAAQIQISPEGNRAVAVVTRKAVKNETEYYYTRHLYLFDLATKSEPVQLTFGDRNDSQPQWSPDGRSIAFTRADNGKSQIWILPLTGGEAHVFTSEKYGASNPRWSPDGKQILFSSAVPFHAIEGQTPWPGERPGRTQGDEPNWKKLTEEEKKKITATPDGNLDEVRAWLAKNAVDNNPRVLNRLNLQGELTLEPEQQFSHLFVKNLSGDDKPVQLTTGYQNFLSAEWSPDGKAIVCHSKKYSADPDRNDANDLWTVNPSTREARVLVAWADHNLFNAQYSPDGSTILFYSEDRKNTHATQTLLATVPAAGGTPKVLTATFDRDMNGAVWSADSKTVYFIAQTEGDIPLFSIPAKGGGPVRLVGNDSGVNDFDVRGDRVVYALTETRNPWELYQYSLKDKSNRALTRLNEDWVKDKAVVMPKEYWFTRPDGTRIQYWVMEPVGRKDGTRYPAILNIHGGPSAMWGPGIFSMWHEYQLETSWGYGVVYCNPRGSGGYGDKFKKGNYQDWGTGPAADILASLEEAMKQHAWIDKEQLFVEGGSYAGYMVSWIIGHDQRFKAANAQRGVYELTTFMGEGNAWRLIPTHFGGYPWQPDIKSILDSNSPLTYVDKINTPLLIIHGDQDLRTGVTQSEMLYKSLKILGKPVEYIRYPGEGHELTRSGNPRRMMDHLLRVIEFFERYATHPEPAPATMGQ
jgi:dipeptidyl aminopeptidase/acylaminoacyl peptidase